MPVSERQRVVACIALSIKRGKTSKRYSAQVAKMAETMSEAKLSEWCSGPIEKK